MKGVAIVGLIMALGCGVAYAGDTRVEGCVRFLTTEYMTEADGVDTDIFDRPTVSHERRMYMTAQHKLKIVQLRTETGRSADYYFDERTHKFQKITDPQEIRGGMEIVFRGLRFHFTCSVGFVGSNSWPDFIEK